MGYSNACNFSVWNRPILCSKRYRKSANTQLIARPGPDCSRGTRQWGWDKQYGFLSDEDGRPHPVLYDLAMAQRRAEQHARERYVA